MNATAIAVQEPLATDRNRSEELLLDLKEFKDEYKKGRRNTFVYTTERVNNKILFAGAVSFAGGFFGTAPDQFLNHTLVGFEARRLSNPIDSVRLSLALNIMPNFTSFSDTSIGDFTTQTYVTVGYFTDFIDKNSFDLSGFPFQPILSFNCGEFSWTKTGGIIDFIPYYQEFTLNNTIANRDIQIVGGTAYPDFTDNPTQLTQADYDKFIVQGGYPLAISIAFDASGLAFQNAAFMASNFFGQISYAFSYYGVLASSTQV